MEITISRVTPDSKASGLSPADRNNIDTVERGWDGDNRIRTGEQDLAL